MCRAIWALAIGPDEETCGRIRRAAGADVQVVAMATTLAQARDFAEETTLDVAIVHAAAPDAYGIVGGIRRTHSRLAVVWIGDGPPDGAHVAIGDGEVDADHLPAAVTRALIACRH